MLFSEIYSVYYSAVSQLIAKAVDGELNSKNAKEIINSKAFSESFVYILDNIKGENWLVLSKDFTTPIKRHPPQVITTLEKRFLKTISLDPRFKLFCEFDINEFDGIEPLYLPTDLYCFDKINDGDPYEDESYIINFRKILVGLEENKLLRIVYCDGNDILQSKVVTPRKLEFSEKDDKFRLVCLGKSALTTINLSTIKSVEFAGVFNEDEIKPFKMETSTVTLQIANYRNTLERSMVHFSHFQKQARKIDDLNYEMELTYCTEDETEVLIRILAFGPMVKVVAPSSFITLVKERIDNQKSCE